MRVFIAEDNEFELTYLKNMISREVDMTVVGEATEGSNALFMINSLKPDVVFLDITMPRLSGIEISKMIDKNIKVVFITAHHDHAIDAFKIGSVDYILKPVDEDRIQISLERLRKSWGTMENEKLPVKVGNATIFVDINDIILIEKIKGLKKVAIYTFNSSYVTRFNISSLEHKLGKFGLVRTHKSFLVNINKIEKILPWGDKSYLVKLAGIKKDVLISRKYAPIVRSLLDIHDK